MPNIEESRKTLTTIDERRKEHRQRHPRHSHSASADCTYFVFLFGEGYELHLLRAGFASAVPVAQHVTTPVCANLFSTWPCSGEQSLSPMRSHAPPGSLRNVGWLLVRNLGGYAPTRRVRCQPYSSSQAAMNLCSHSLIALLSSDATQLIAVFPSL